MSELLILDGNNILHAAYHKLSGMSTKKGIKTNGIFGFPRILTSLMKKFETKPKDVYICWDGKKSLGRLKKIPTYKERDKKKLTFDAEDFYEQRFVVMEMMDYLGLKQVYDATMEADDNIYTLCRKFRLKKKIIVSTDKDFHQLLNKNTSIWNTKEQVIFTPKNIKHRKGYTPKQCVDYLSLLGDKSDNIPGYKGIGEMKAKEFLNQFDSIKNFLSDKSNSYSIIKHEILAELYILNKYMIDLRHYYILEVRKEDKKDYPIRLRTDKPKFKQKKFTNLCHKYQINTFRKDEFLNIFR